MLGFNVLTAIVNIANYENTNLEIYSTKSKIRINTVGEKLEYYFKDAIANSFQIKEQSKRIKIHSSVFSWLGNQNNPPDMIINKGDAFEVKKNQSMKSTIALNNSYPKNKLYIDDPKITKECFSCEEEQWGSKDIFYVIGSMNGTNLQHLFIVQGECYAANRKIYSNLLLQFKAKVDTLIQEQNMESTKTREVGRITRVDPLGITTFRIRGMWEIRNPLVVFGDYNINSERYKLSAIMLKEKYQSFAEKDIKLLESNPKIIVEKIRIPNHNNQAKLLTTILINILRT